MLNSNFAVLAIMAASASAQAVGTAHVVNMCKYDVYLCNVPASGGGYEQTEETLSSGQSWSHPWTALSNGAGWSIKLSESSSLNNILQYEYTWQNDGTIWYDLSCVNGNPWDGNWEITSSTSNCNPKQQAYRYATDDAYGMQSCPGDASITVTLCSGEATNNGTYSSVESAAAPAYSSTSEPVAPAYTPPAAPVTHGYNWNNADVSSSLPPSPVQTTLATQIAAPVVGPSGNVMIETLWVTEVVTATAYAAKPRARRHAHHPGHA